MKYAEDITDEDKTEFVDLLRDGLDPGSAARAIGTTGTQMRKFRRAHTQYYDPDFAQACDDAEQSPNRPLIRRQRLEDAFWAAVENGEKWAIEKGLYAYHPDFEHLRHTNLRVTGSIEHTARMLLPHMTDDEIQARIDEIEARKTHLALAPDRPQLPPAA